MMIGVLLTFWLIPQEKPAKGAPETKGSRLSRVDFLGATLLGCCIIAFLLPTQLGGTYIPWNDARIFLLFGASFLFGYLFVICEKSWAKEPVFPLSLLTHRDVVHTYLASTLQIGAQSGMMFTVPIYFQVTRNASSSAAGAHLFPAVVGNAIGGLLTGFVIRRTGRYKALTVCAMILSIICYTLLVVRWRGNTNWWESLYIIPGGFASGIVGSALFVALQTGLKGGEVAIACSGLYLSSSLGVLVSLALVSAVQQSSLRDGLQHRLADFPHGEEIIKKALADIGFVRSLTGEIRNQVNQVYVQSLEYCHCKSS